MWFVILCVLQQNFVHIGTSVLIELVAAAEDYERDFAVAQYGQFVSFLHHAELAFVEGDLPIPLVCNPRYLDFLATHGSNFDVQLISYKSVKSNPCKSLIREQASIFSIHLQQHFKITINSHFRHYRKDHSHQK